MWTYPCKVKTLTLYFVDVIQDNSMLIIMLEMDLMKLFKLN